MKYCKSCGKQLSEKAMFCANCGKKISESEKASYEEVKREFIQKYWWIFAIIIGIIIGFALYILLIHSGSTGKMNTFSSPEDKLIGKWQGSFFDIMPLTLTFTKDGKAIYEVNGKIIVADYFVTNGDTITITGNGETDSAKFYIKDDSLFLTGGQTTTDETGTKTQPYTTKLTRVK